MAMDDYTDNIGRLSSMDSGPTGAGPGPVAPQPTGPGSGMGEQPGTMTGPGGPGADTPQEQQALQMLLQGAAMFRRATEIEPSIRYIIDDLLQKAYLGVTKHYGLEQEGKLALQQAQLQANRNRAVALTGPPRRPAAPSGAIV